MEKLRQYKHIALIVSRIILILLNPLSVWDVLSEKKKIFCLWDKNKIKSIAVIDPCANAVLLDWYSVVRLLIL